MTNLTIAISENKNSEKILKALSIVDVETKYINAVEIIKQISLARNGWIRYELIIIKHNRFKNANDTPEIIISFFITISELVVAID